MKEENNTSYLIKVELSEEDVKNSEFIPGIYFAVVKNSENRVQYKRKNDKSEYFVVFDEKGEDDCTVDELLKKENILHEKIVEKLITEMI